MTGVLKKIAAFLAARWRVLSAFGIYHILGWIFDNPVWICVELKWGWMGVKGMIVAAILLNISLLLFYRRRKADWILWDALHAQEKYQKIKKYGNILAFIGLSIFEDPFVATTFIRQEKGESPNGLKTKDVAVFSISLIVSIGYWAIRNGLITEGAFRPILKSIGIF